MALLRRFDVNSEVLLAKDDVTVSLDAHMGVRFYVYGHTDR
jgi:hypothetical protein